MAIGFAKGLGSARAATRGFGLIELMVTVAIVAVLAAIALPNYQNLMQKNRVATDTNNFLAALNLARNEAIARGRPVTVCASTSGTACDGNATDIWTNGFIVFTDYDPVGTIDAGSGDTIIRSFDKLSFHDALTSGGGNVGYISFTRTGTARFPNAANTSAAFTLTPTPCVLDMKRDINVTSLGRSMSKPSNCP